VRGSADEAFGLVGRMPHLARGLKKGSFGRRLLEIVPAIDSLRECVEASNTTGHADEIKAGNRHKTTQ